MSKRMLHENITTSDKFTKISCEAECLYCRLLTQTDDYGNVRGSIGYVKDVCFPRGKENKKIDYQMVGKWLAECRQHGLLLPYIVDDIEYYHFDRFEDFQQLRKDRIKKSSIPTYSKVRSNGCHIDNQMVADCPHELEVELELELEDVVSKIPTLEEVNTYAIARGRTDLTKKFHDWYTTANWKDNKGKPIKNWKLKFLAWEGKNDLPLQTSSTNNNPPTDPDEYRRYLIEQRGSN